MNEPTRTDIRMEGTRQMTTITFHVCGECGAKRRSASGLTAHGRIESHRINSRRQAMLAAAKAAR